MCDTRLFPFDQDFSEKTCAVRCLAYVTKMPYREYLLTLSDLKPEVNGMYFVDIYRQLQKYGIGFSHSFPSERGLFMILLYRPGAAQLYRPGAAQPHGPGDYVHYVIYHDGILYDSLLSEPVPKTLDELRETIEESIGTGGPVDAFFDKQIWCIRIKE